MLALDHFPSDHSEPEFEPPCSLDIESWVHSALGCADSLWRTLTTLPKYSVSFPRD